MTNRYAAEIHINPIRFLRNDDFNNEGHIEDIKSTLAEAIQLNEAIHTRLLQLQVWLQQSDYKSASFHFADGGYISMKGASDKQLLELKKKGMVELFDFATDKNWVKKYGSQFGLIWEDGRAVEI
ncbi:MAG: hypothetical protein JNM78_03155 [Cyclobacteriaceae bacterium]|nr:hypothetical protein [Cyclobacteriaceae bacterium]